MTELNYTRKDFTSDQEVRWCPGCGDYAILNAAQQTMAKLGRKKEDIVFVSGIGCSSRFPYYMNTYGLHTIHGRAPAIATGLKITNPDLSVWVVTGDGDGLSIGGNHLIHAIRRNIDMNLLLFNNEIYGLTKGQYSPTSKQGTVTKSTPFGSLDRPFYPAKIALGAGATFFARTMDTDPKHMQEIFLAAEAHRGLSFIEILQNCVIFNDKIHESYTNRKLREENVIFLEEGKPLVFGRDDQKKGLIFGKGGKLEIVDAFASEGSLRNDLLIHDSKNDYQAHLLANLLPHQGPLPMGILKKVEDVRYDNQLNAQITHKIEEKGRGKLENLLNAGNVWEVNE